MNDNENVYEEIDFISSRQSITYEHRNGNSKEDSRPMSDMTEIKKHEFTHRRPSSLSNIQFANTERSLTSPEAPTSMTVKHVEFPKENVLLRKVQQQQYKRAISSNTEVTDKDIMTHRRTQSNIPFGSSGTFIELGLE